MKSFLIGLAQGLAVIAAIAVLCLISATLTRGCRHSEEFRQRELREALYPAWKKAHPATQLTFAEWNELRKENLLPR